MRIAWFTPFVPTSAIGEKFSRVIADALAKEHHVDVWVCDVGALCRTNAHIVRYGSADAVDTEQLRNYDVVAYNLGDNYLYHKEMYLLSQRFPGIVILHDYVFHNFVPAHFRLGLDSPLHYIFAMEKFYGERADGVLREFLEGRSIVGEDRTVDFPLFEEVCSRAIGVVVHSKFFLQNVQAVFAGPATRIFLAHERATDKPAHSRDELGVSSQTSFLLSIGYLNRNRRIDKVIAALAEVKNSAPDFRYHVVGPVFDLAYKKVVEETIVRFGLEQNVRLVDYVDEATLYAYLSHADICINLRFPSTEGASASVVEQLLHGKPVIVTNTGFYEELPNDTVMKIEIAAEEAALPRTLLSLMNDPRLRRQLGERGRLFAQEHSSAENYVREFLAFTEIVRDVRPIFDFERRLAAHLSVMSVDETMGLPQQVLTEAYGLFLKADPE